MGKNIRNIVALTESGTALNGKVFVSENDWTLSCRWSVPENSKNFYFTLDEVTILYGDIYYVLIEFENMKVMSMDVTGMKWNGAYIMSSNDAWIDFLTYIRF